MLPEELIDTGMFSTLPFPRQSALIEEYCFGFRDIIERASSKQEATQSAEIFCKAFSLQCNSSVIQSALQQHIFRLIDDRWE